MPQPLELDRVQRWMQAVITHPQGAAAGIDAPSAREQIDCSTSTVHRVIQPSQALTSIERLHVYASAYFARLLECLRSEFPALLHALGEETFDAFAFGYLQQYPSTSYTLANLGARFPQYLAETRPESGAALRVAQHDVGVQALACHEQPEGWTPTWPQFLIDLAVLERTYSEVFDGPGWEGQPLLSADTLAQILPQQWEHARLRPVPCLRLLAFGFPAHEYASAVRRGEPAELPASRPTWLAVTRRDYIVRRTPLLRVQYELLAVLCAGEPLGGAIARACATVEPQASAADVQQWFRQWTAAGYFLNVF